MAEAMFFGLPIVSHFSTVNNGHAESIGEAGKVLSSVEEYGLELLKLEQNPEYYNFRSENARERFAEKYELDGQIKNFENIYKDVIRNPFPNRLQRILSRYSWRFLILYPFVKISVKLLRGINKIKLPAI